MADYKSSENPNLIIIPPKAKSEEEKAKAAQKELELSHRKGELMGLYQKILEYNAHLDELRRIQALLADEAERIQGEIETAESRIKELETILKV